MVPLMAVWGATRPVPIFVGVLRDDLAALLLFRLRGYSWASSF